MKSLKAFLFIAQPSIYFLLSSIIYIIIPNSILHVSPDFSFPFIFFWTIFKPELLPLFTLLSVGIVSDSIQGLPLGFHSILFLCSSMILLPQRSFLYHQSFLLVWAVFGLSLIFYKGLELLILRSFMEFPFSLSNLALSVLFTVFLYPLCAKLSYLNLKKVINLS
ncbi:hypothetical protein IM40_05325 [Candidatus Paracaedimonas acanthamoebae]|nr:hypothetical protein IM40_05325 [Candidatus Paracaedimonas acanthamoebae]